MGTKKPTASNLSESAQNKIVKFVSANQNAKKKLNAGQIREMIRLIYIALGTQITPDEVLHLSAKFQADPLSIKTVKAVKIARLEEKLAEAKKA